MWKFPGYGSNQSCSCRPTPQPEQHRIQAAVCDLHHSSWQCWILNPLSEARDQTRVLMDTSQAFYGQVTMGTPLIPALRGNYKGEMNQPVLSASQYWPQSSGLHWVRDLERTEQWNRTRGRGSLEKTSWGLLGFFFFFFFWFFVCFFRATPAAYGSSQTRGQIEAAVADLRHSHSHTESEPRLQPTP